MSFVQQLGRATMAARETFAEQTMQELMRQCQDHASWGCSSCVTNIQASPQVRDGEGVRLILHEKLQEMGFEDISVSQRWLPQQRWNYHIQVKWKVEAKVPENTGKEPEGTSSTCPVCLENRPVVALIPCGHVVCQQCQGSQQFRQCPMCRADVTGATRALFM